MGKEIKVTCDDCGTYVFGKKYFTLNIQKVIHGKQQMHPAVYLCPNCFRETILALLLCYIGETSEEVKNET